MGFLKTGVRTQVKKEGENGEAGQRVSKRISFHQGPFVPDYHDDHDDERQTMTQEGIGLGLGIGVKGEGNTWGREHSRVKQHHVHTLCLRLFGRGTSICIVSISLIICATGGIIIVLKERHMELRAKTASLSGLIPSTYDILATNEREKVIKNKTVF